MKRRTSLVGRIFTSLMIVGLLLPTLAAAGPLASATKPLSEEQKIMHVLNRLGFGARPGDVEKVKAIGISKYIDQQLDPASITDASAENKVRSLDVFGMSTGELFAKYPNPGALLQQLEGRERAAKAKPEKGLAEPMKEGDKEAPPQDPNAMTQAEQRERREKINALYREYDLKPAAQIVPQILSNRLLRAVYSERQLQEVMVDFWQNHFNVFAGKAAVRWYIPSYERDVLRKNALGSFKDLVVETARHPAMLFYLDNFESISPNAQTPGNNANTRHLQQVMKNGGQLPRQVRQQMKRNGLSDAEIDPRAQQLRKTPAAQPQRQRRGINENYARELMELHTLGVDGGYSQKDIIEVAKCFTGWTIADPRGYRRAAASTIEGTEDRRMARLQRQAGVPDDIESGEFYFNQSWHERDAKTVLGQKVDEGGVKDGLKVIDILVNHPSTAKFIAKKLAVKFVSDSPSEALIGRVAATFQKSSGDIKTTLKALFSDKEFFAPENYRAKIKSPFELAVSSVRTLGADTNASPAMLAMLNKLGEVPYGYQAPTGYPDTAEDWVNTGALLERMNFAIAIASNRIPGTRVDLKRFDAPDKAQILDKAISTILDGDVSPATRATLLRQAESPLPQVKEGKDLDAAGLDVPNMRDTGQQRGQTGRPGY